MSERWRTASEGGPYIRRSATQDRPATAACEAPREENPKTDPLQKAQRMGHPAEKGSATRGLGDGEI